MPSLCLVHSQPRFVVLPGSQPLTPQLHFGRFSALTVRRARPIAVSGPANLLVGGHVLSASITNPEEFREIRAELIEGGVLPLTSRLERAVAEGDLPEGTDVGQIIDGLESSLVFHLLIAPRGQSNKELAADLERYVTNIVDVAMIGLQNR